MYIDIEFGAIMRPPAGLIAASTTSALQRGKNMNEQMHNFEQVRDVLDYGIRLHGRLTEVYDRLQQQSDQTRVKMVLEYLSRHERNREQAMQRFEDGARKNILETWLQYAPSSNIEQLLSQCAGRRSDLNVDDVIKLAMCFDDALIAIYEETARESDDPRVRALFENLAEMETHEKQRFIRDAEWVQDI